MKGKLIITLCLSLFVNLHAAPECDPCPPRWELFGNLLFWKANEETSSFIANIEGRSPSGKYLFEVKEMTFDWDFGARAGIGYHLPYDSWHTQLYWTGYETTAKKHLRQHAGDDLSPEFFAGFMTEFVKADEVLHGTVSWKIQYHMFDWELGKQFQCGHFLKLRPYLGLKGGIINQTIKATWDSVSIPGRAPFKGSETVINHFTGIGPVMGVDSTWGKICCNNHAFSLFGNGSFSTLFGNWEIKDRYRDPRPQKMKVVMDDQQFGALMVRGFAGINWDVSLKDGASRLSTRLGYEAQLWFSQLRLPTFQQLIIHGDLILHGATLECRINF